MGVIMDDSLKDYKKESCLFSLPPKQFALLGAILGIVMAENLNMDEKNAMGNFLVSIGQSMMTEAAQEQVLQDAESSQSDGIRQEIEELKRQLYILTCEGNKNTSRKK